MRHGSSRWLLLLQLVAVGCGAGPGLPSVQVVRMGPQLPAKPPRCGIPTLAIDAQQVGLAFETLGSLIVRSELDAEARRALEEQACQLGGDYLVPAMTVGTTSTFFVVRPRPGIRVRDGQVIREGAVGGQPPAVKPVVAVAPIEDRAGVLSPDEKEQLTVYLATQMAGTDRYRVVPPDQARARLSADKRESYRLCYETRCQIELGKALAAQKTVAARLLKLAGQCSLAVNLYDLKTETAELAATSTVPCTAAGVQAGIDKLTLQLGSGVTAR